MGVINFSLKKLIVFVALQRKWLHLQEAAVERDSQQLQVHQRINTFEHDFQLLTAFLSEAEATQAAQTVLPTNMADLEKAARAHKVL